MKQARYSWLAGLILVVGLAVMAGCGGGDSQQMILNVIDRATYQGVAAGRLAFAALGGNGLMYVYSVNQAGDSFDLLTATANNPSNVLEGGWNPSYNPAGDVLAFASKRSATVCLYTMSATGGDAAGVTKLTADTPDGGDDQPSWSNDGSKIIYASTRVNGRHALRTVNVVGGAVNPLALNWSGADGYDNQYPMYNPTNANQIVFQSNHDSDSDYDLFLFTIGNPSPTKIAAADSSFDEGGARFSPDGSKIAFHSNRGGDYDIWVYTVAGATLTQLTSDAYSDGFPVWNNDGSRIAFTRDRELWDMAAGGGDLRRIVKRY